MLKNEIQMMIEAYKKVEKGKTRKALHTSAKIIRQLNKFIAKTPGDGELDYIQLYSLKCLIESREIPTNPEHRNYAGPNPKSKKEPSKSEIIAKKLLGLVLNDPVYRYHFALTKNDIQQMINLYHKQKGGGKKLLKKSGGMIGYLQGFINPLEDGVLKLDDLQDLRTRMRDRQIPTDPSHRNYFGPDRKSKKGPSKSEVLARELYTRAFYAIRHIESGEEKANRDIEAKMSLEEEKNKLIAKNVREPSTAEAGASAPEAGRQTEGRNDAARAEEKVGILTKNDIKKMIDEYHVEHAEEGGKSKKFGPKHFVSKLENEFMTMLPDGELTFTNLRVLGEMLIYYASSTEKSLALARELYQRACHDCRELNKLAASTNVKAKMSLKNEKKKSIKTKPIKKEKVRKRSMAEADTLPLPQPVSPLYQVREPLTTKAGAPVAKRQTEENHAAARTDKAKKVAEEKEEAMQKREKWVNKRDVAMRVEEEKYSMLDISYKEEESKNLDDHFINYQLIPLLKDSPRLTKLNLAGKYFTGFGFYALRELLCVNSLLELNLEGNPIGDAGAKSFKGTTLTALNISGCYVTDEGLKAFEDNPNIISLSINATADGKKITAEGIRAIASMPNLEQLEISGSLPGVEGCQLLAGMKKLKYLAMNGCEINAEQLSAFENNGSLIYLRVCHNPIGDKGFKIIPTMKALKCLDAEDANLMDVAARCIARSDTLEDVDLYSAEGAQFENKITIEGVYFIRGSEAIAKLRLPPAGEKADEVLKEKKYARVAEEEQKAAREKAAREESDIAVKAIEERDDAVNALMKLKEEKKNDKASKTLTEQLQYSPTLFKGLVISEQTCKNTPLFKMIANELYPNNNRVFTRSEVGRIMERVGRFAIAVAQLHPEIAGDGKKIINEDYSQLTREQLAEILEKIKDNNQLVKAAVLQPRRTW